jgi:hypothetical protein
MTTRAPVTTAQPPAVAAATGARALVIGGTGPTGIPIVRGLLDRGYEVTSEASPRVVNETEDSKGFRVGATEPGVGLAYSGPGSRPRTTSTFA